VSPEDWDFVRTHLSTLGRQVRVSFPGGSEIQGVAEDIDSRGQLIVTKGTRTEVISAGDIEHLRAL
jgi:BirA family biotin operon repressor/biotin-[acetyl-CoA-carboxylase] ligase